MYVPFPGAARRKGILAPPPGRFVVAPQHGHSTRLWAAACWACRDALTSPMKSAPELFCTIDRDRTSGWDPALST